VALNAKGASSTGAVTSNYDDHLWDGFWQLSAPMADPPGGTAMTHCFRALGCLIALAAAAALPLPPAHGADAPKRSALAGVAALEKPITLSETKIPLGELVQKVAAETGVTLTATPAVADEPVALAVKELPARRLLEEVAALLDYLWLRRTGKGVSTSAASPASAAGPPPAFEITQDLAGK
jgi:hypothetical protein